MTTCRCNIGLANTGLPTGCQHISKVAERAIFLHYFDSTGAVNKVDTTDTLDQTYFEALVNETDKTKRWYPIGRKFENVEQARQESSFEEFDSGLKFRVQTGVKSFTGLLPETPAKLTKFFNSGNCLDLGVFFIDSEGNLIGNGEEYGFLKPFRVARGTMDGIEVPAKDKNVQRLMVKFDFDETESDDAVSMIESSEMSYSPKNLRGLFDAKGSFSSITNTGFVVEIYTPYGTAKNPLLVPGLVAGDFDLTKADGTAISITSVTESTVKKGRYTFVHAAAGTGAKAYLTFTKTGYDSSELGAQLIQYP